MAPKYTLFYFNGMGRAETIRFMFHVAGVQYKDKRITKEEWAELKPNMPFGKLPVLEIDGKKVPESNAICRFLAKEFELTAKKNLDIAIVDAVSEIITEVREKLIKLATSEEEDEEKKKEMKMDFKEKDLKPFLENIEKFISKNKHEGEKGFIFSEKLTWADLHLLVLSDNLVRMVEKEKEEQAEQGGQEEEEEEDMYEAFPKCKAVIERINQEKKVIEWKEKRPQTTF